MSGNKYNYKLTISKSVYFQDGEEYPVDTPYLMFQADGNVALQGSDDVGEFEFTGYAEDEFLYLKKQYIGQHTVYYVGKLEENNLNLFYSFEEDNEGGKAKVEAGEFNALMEFESQRFRLFREGPAGESWSMFLRNDDSGKQKGLGRMKGKTCKISYKTKEENKGKIQLKYNDYEKTFKVDTGFDGLGETDLVVNMDCNNEYKLETNGNFYIIEGQEYGFYLPYLTFDDNGSFQAQFTDNNGLFTVTGNFQNEWMQFQKTYSSDVNVWYVGRFNGDRLELAYNFQSDSEEELRGKVEAGEYNAHMRFNLAHYNFELDGQVSHTFLYEDGHKHRGFCIHEGKNYYISLKTKEGKRTKLKMKRDKEIRYVRVEINHDEFLITPGDIPLGMGL